MTTHALNGYEKEASVISEDVWFEGTTALLEGQAVCYNFNYGTATDKDGRRCNRVEVPSVTNARFFAGVCDQKHAASSTGQLIRINKPGSWCNVLAITTGDDTVVGVGRLTFEITATVATNGSFRLAGLPGEGSCTPMQTVDLSEESAGVTVFAKLETGPASGGVQSVQTVDNTAFVAMVGGTTYLVGHAGSGGNSTFALVQGTYEGQRKKFAMITTAMSGGNTVVITPATDGLTIAGGALDTITLDAVSEIISLEYFAGRWATQGLTGATEA